MKKTFLKELLHRRVPQIIGSYLIASISLVGALDWMVARYDLSGTYTTLAIFCLISIIPSVVVLAYFHGAPGKDEWTKIEKYGIPVNVIFIALAIIFGKSFESESEPVDDTWNTFYYYIDSRQSLVDNIMEVYSKEELKSLGVDEIEPVDPKLLEEILTDVPPLIHAKLLHKDVTLYSPKNTKERKEMYFLPPAAYYENLISNKDAEDLDPLDDHIENGFKNLVEIHGEKNIDLFITVFLYRVKKEGRWGTIYDLSFWFIEDNESLTYSYSTNEYIDWEDDKENDIKKDLADGVAKYFLDQRYGGSTVGKVEEILDDNLVSIRIDNDNMNLVKGNKLEGERHYYYNYVDIDFDEELDKKLDDILVEVQYIKNNPLYIIDNDCKACLKYKLSTKKKDEADDIRYLLNDYLEEMKIEIDSLKNFRDALKAEYLDVDGTKRGDADTDIEYTLEVVKVTDTHVIAKITDKLAPFVIPKIYDWVTLIID